RRPSGRDSERGFGLASFNPGLVRGGSVANGAAGYGRGRWRSPAAGGVFSQLFWLLESV
ncbi:hypothetical protein HPP92_027955, partial [Vanilla planifolia]